MVRHAEDLAPLLRVLVGPRADLLHLHLPWPARLRLVSLEGDGGFPLTSRVTGDLLTAQVGGSALY